MKLIYRGGCGEKDKRQSLFYEYANLVKKWASEKKNIAVITLARPNGTHNQQPPAYTGGLL